MSPAIYERISKEVAGVVIGTIIGFALRQMG